MSLWTTVVCHWHCGLTMKPAKACSEMVWHGTPIYPLIQDWPLQNWRGSAVCLASGDLSLSSEAREWCYRQGLQKDRGWEEAQWTKQLVSSPLSFFDDINGNRGLCAGLMFPLWCVFNLWILTGDRQAVSVTAHQAQFLSSHSKGKCHLPSVFHLKAHTREEQRTPGRHQVWRASSHPNQNLRDPSGDANLHLSFPFKQCLVRSFSSFFNYAHPSDTTPCSSAAHSHLHFTYDQFTYHYKWIYSLSLASMLITESRRIQRAIKWTIEMWQYRNLIDKRCNLM